MGAVGGRVGGDDDLDELCRIVELERFSIRRAITSSSLCAATITVTVGKMSPRRTGRGAIRAETAAAAG